MLQNVFQGALSRDLLGAKDSGGRDPAVSYGDVQLQRHLERFQRLDERLTSEAEDVTRSGRCAIGRWCVRLFVSALYSGLQWDAWFRRHRADLAAVVGHANWTAPALGGWPLLEIVGLIADLGATVELPVEDGWCGDTDFGELVAVSTSSAERLREVAGPLARQPSCGLARALGVAALAAAEAVAPRPPRATAAAAARRAGVLLREVQVSLRRAIEGEGAGAGMGAEILFAPPLPSFLGRVAGFLRSSAERLAERPFVDVIYCGHLDLQDYLQELCAEQRGRCAFHMRTTESHEESLRVCYDHYRRSVQALTARPTQSDLDSTIVVSPLAWQWRPETGQDVWGLITERQRWGNEIVWAGLPCLNRSSIWNWPVRRLRHQYWKLAYEDYATGHETSRYIPLAQDWAVGSTTSGTRVYQTRMLMALEAELLRLEQDGPAALPGAEAPLGPPAAGAVEWLVALDLAALGLGVRAYTRLAGASLEDDYRWRAKLSPRLSRTFHIEAARFHPTAGQEQHCLFPSSREASAFTSSHGVVVSWCTRRRLRDMFQAVGRWWLNLSPRGHIIVPVSASVLNIFRSGEAELFPWDADIDANFIADHPLVVGSILEEHAETIRGLGYTWILKGDRTVFMDLADTVRMDVWLSGPQEVAAYNVRSRLCGVRVNFFEDQLKGIVWYYRPGEKIYGNTKGQLLHCTWDGHNACLPDCLRDGLGVGSDGCEFPDRFVHLDA
eukprot:TRINITY_DN23220_c0_g1_i1.p1 TRINITY_DN23220_c0_g1~~TRINITY_DN23220_c0_g1_i1.p1  ORF type:complete len:810 (-),score=135.11 TRINITY_DN23220_c0_g1_i1:51-2228(-)